MLIVPLDGAAVKCSWCLQECCVLAFCMWLRETQVGHSAVAINITGVSRLVHVELFSSILTCSSYSFAVILCPISHTYTHYSAPFILSPLSSIHLCAPVRSMWGCDLFRWSLCPLISGWGCVCTVLVYVLSWPRLSGKSSGVWQEGWCPHHSAVNCLYCLLLLLLFLFFSCNRI